MPASKDSLAQIVAVSGSIISGLIALSTVFGVLYAALVMGRVPEPLGDWGGIIIGFFFGQFFSFTRGVLTDAAKG